MRGFTIELTGYLSVMKPNTGDARQYGRDNPSMMSPTEPGESLNWCKRTNKKKQFNKHRWTSTCLFTRCRKVLNHNYRIDGKQWQRGIQEAQSRAEGEDHVADEDNFWFGEETEEGVLRRRCLCRGWSTSGDYFPFARARLPINQNATYGRQDVYVEGNHEHQQASKEQKRNFISERLVEPAAQWRS